MSNDEEIQLLREIEDLLERQIGLARRENFAAMEQLAAQCEPLVSKIAAAGLLERPEYKAQRERLLKLYRNLQLALSTQKDMTVGQLKSIHMHKRTLATYRGSV